jgi:hypothetical protein
MKDAAGDESLVIIEGMLEEPFGTRVAVAHQIFADKAGRVGETIGKKLAGGE